MTHNHILIFDRVSDKNYSPKKGGKNFFLCPVERRAHGMKLLKELEVAFEKCSHSREQSDINLDELKSLGSIIVIEGAKNSTTDKYELVLERLEKYSQNKTRKEPKWLLLTVSSNTDSESEKATVWVADDFRNEFRKIFEDYIDESNPPSENKKGEPSEPTPKNNRLVANMSHIREATLHDLWTSASEPQLIEKQWWELWFDKNNTDINKLQRIFDCLGIPSRTSIILQNRIIIQVKCKWDKLSVLIYHPNMVLSEIRQPGFFDTIEELSTNEQDEYVDDLVSRLTYAEGNSPAVCLLDTGVYIYHFLLKNSLANGDWHTIIGNDPDDLCGHGTAMAGIALFGNNLDRHLAATSSVKLEHRLESVRVLNQSRGEDENPASAIIKAIALPEATSDRQRVYCLPLSAETDRVGEPTLYSAVLDALSIGMDLSSEDSEELLSLSCPDSRLSRLFFVAAGNVSVSDFAKDHLTVSDITEIESPGQAWNVVTVGAYTELVDKPKNPDYAGWEPLAERGELSPHSRTSGIFPGKHKLIKPDICMEGGNVLTDGSQFHERYPLLSLRTTGKNNIMSLVSTNATSAATAQAARLAVLAMSNYPEYWPETIRGLLIHAAEWTPIMSETINAKRYKKDKFNLLQRYGWGVPTEERVLNSTSQRVMLVTQDEFKAFSGTDFKVENSRLHELPWPKKELENLGNAKVRLRITLSYFVEPSASRRGWRQKYSYASHKLRFDMQGPQESQPEFIARLARDSEMLEENKAFSSPSSGRWFLGPQQRNHGSLHQDDWHGTGIELSQCNSIAVYPVGGWWKNNKRKDREDFTIRYSLLVSISTSKEGVDLYTPIVNELKLPIEVNISK